MIVIECSGVAVSGESALIASAAYTGAFHGTCILTIIGAAIAGAIVGNLVGYGIGRFLDYCMLVRYGSYIRLSELRLNIGEYLFRHYGMAAVIAGRFVPLLRSTMPVLAGANRMLLQRYFIANALGAAAWVMFDAFASFCLGKKLRTCRPPP